MKIKPFAVEEWMNEYENGAKYNIAETCVNSVTLNELFELTGIDKQTFFDDFSKKRLTYGDIEGNPTFKAGICKLYKTAKPDEIVTTHGASGANHHVFYSLIEPNDKVISIMPTYQQLYSIPEGFGARVEMLELKPENGYLIDLEELRKIATKDTKLICINNPNNPTGALMSEEMLMNIVEIAREVDAYILCDEVYRHLTQKDEWCTSIVDLYEKGISVSSMSKVFSLAGLRLGWIISHDKEFIKSCFSHRDYNHVSCGMFDETIAGIALEHSEVFLDRNRDIVRENAKILDEWIQSQPKVSYFKPQAGTTSLVHYELEINSRDFCDELYKTTGTLVVPGDCFEQPKSIRIGYACSSQELREGLEKLGTFINSKI
ncbi:MAG: aminotransferase [Clostridia bacterium]